MTPPTRASFLPDLCGLQALFTVVIAGQLLAFALTLARGASGLEALAELALLSLYIQWIGLSAAATLCLSRRHLRRLGERREASLAYGLVLLVALLLAESAWWLMTPFGSELPLLQISHARLLLCSLGITAIVAAVVLRYFYVQHQWRERTAAAAAAQLQALQARIRPHFLFNCMNTIASLIRANPAAAERAVEDLSDLLRASLASTQPMVPLEAELTLVRRYLAIEALRLGGRLQVVWALPVLPTALEVPQLSLQPLVENALRHGIEPLPAGGVVRIGATLENGRLRLWVSNPLPPAGQLQAHGNRLAQDNLRQRLQARYGEAADLHIEETGDEYLATMTLPCGTDGDAHRNR